MTAEARSFEETRLLKLGVDEFCLIAGVVGAGNLIGIEDPWPDYTPAQMEAVMAQARATLAQRQLIEVRADNRVIIEPYLAHAISICAFPEAAFILLHSVTDLGQLQRHFFVTRQGAVEMVKGQGEGLTLELHLFSDPRMALHRMHEIFNFLHEPAIACGGGEMAKADLRRLGALAQENGAEPARAELITAGFAPETAAALARTLARPVCNGSLLVMAPTGGEWQVDGFGLLEGENGLWRLSSHIRQGQEWVGFAPTAGADLESEITSLFERCLPTSVS